ncbi:MAG: ATP-binding cassette domain-containing protein [Rikenellaceae bacterium]|nr:ATP-binding cassette domain-containing protein [Rikenellaceae bacterium]
MDEKKVIELEGVSIYHSGESLRNSHRGELVLSEVNLSVGGGELVYLIGKVGSGKSTLLKTLYGEVPLKTGKGRIVGFDLRRLRRSRIPYLRRKIGIVFQDHQLLTDRDVFRNLHYVMKATGWRDETLIRRRIAEVLELVGLHNKEYKMPFELSGGEQQRLAIARAVVNSPAVILADEPTGNLDPAAADEIMRLFATIVAGGCSIVMSTHNINVVEDYPARTLLFSQGRIEEIDVAALG